MATSLPSYAADPAIVAARLAVLVASPTAQITALWTGLQRALTTYDLAVASSLASEGVSRSMNFDAAARQVVEWHAAYTTATAATALPADADPELLQGTWGRHWRQNGLPLEF